LVRFVHRLFGAGNNERVSEMLFETKSIIQGYLVGLFTQFAIVAILNSIGLLVIGIEYAILLGITGALLNIIPYIGGLMSVSMFVIFTLITKSPVYLLYVIGLYILIQFIDNNFVVPKVIGSKVKLNALVSIIAVISGAALWGIHGMFLSIPLIAILKLVLDRTESLHAWGFLMGDTMPPIIKIRE
jgi:predicted PurR-regulated permease PerM